jgi:hypothetical protein
MYLYAFGTDLFGLNGNLSDLLGDGADALTSAQSNGTAGPTRNNLMDFQDLLSQTVASSPMQKGLQQQPPQAAISSVRNDDLNNFFDLGESPADASAEERPGQIVLNQRGIEMQLYVDAGFDGNGQASLRFSTSNNNPVPIDDFNLAVAVIKVRIQLTLLTFIQFFRPIKLNCCQLAHPG